MRATLAWNGASSIPDGDALLLQPQAGAIPCDFGVSPAEGIDMALINAHPPAFPRLPVYLI